MSLVRSKHRLIPCRHFANGHCSFAERCTFLHEVRNSSSISAPEHLSVSSSDSGSSRDTETGPREIEAETTLQNLSQRDRSLNGHYDTGSQSTFKRGHDSDNAYSDELQGDPASHNPYYRTRPCAFFQTGRCLKGDLCNYKHDQQSPECDQTQRIVCRYDSANPGSCRYGVKCLFLHIKSASKSTPKVSLSQYRFQTEPSLLNRHKHRLFETQRDKRSCTNEISNVDNTDDAAAFFDLNLNPLGKVHDVVQMETALQPKAANDTRNADYSDSEDEVVYKGDKNLICASSRSIVLKLGNNIHSQLAVEIRGMNSECIP